MTAPAAPPGLDLLLRGGIALTSDPSCPVIEDAVIGVHGDRLALVTSAASAPPGLGARRRVDCAGRVITAGFVNVHTHAILTMARGMAEDMGFAPAYTPGVPRGSDVRPEEARALARLGALEALLFGSTLINDTYVHAEETAEPMAEIGGRVVTCGRIHDVDFTRVADGHWEHDSKIGEASLTAALELAERWHGKGGGRIGVQLSPHAPDTCSDELLTRVAEASRTLGLRANTHLAQSRVEVERVRARSGCHPVELLDRCGLLDDRLLAAHCIFLDDEQIGRVGRAGIAVAHVPKGNATGGMMARTPALREAGARLALGTDNMHADMIETMRWALAIARLQLGRATDDWQPHHALDMATLAGARAMGLEHDLGSITVGKKADLVVLDFRRPHLTPVTNALGNLVHVAQGRDVEMVVVDGRVVVDGGHAVLVDEEEIRRRAEAAARDLWKRARAGATGVRGA
jgi:5-methylthioadenosine/S-adenosylhomocysteine deaminase